MITSARRARPRPDRGREFPSNMRPIQQLLDQPPRTVGRDEDELAKRVTGLDREHTRD
ncbi:hypothetical protein [Nocardia sp. bgisy118]|uniref:hypothetical protein n=1 Tax=Nocardia sp. bgisy118 TaxID=3413786 RepID=UPI003F49C55A